MLSRKQLGKCTKKCYREAVNLGYISGGLHKSKNERRDKRSATEVCEAYSA